MKWFQVLSFWLAMVTLLLAGVCCANADSESEKAIANVTNSSIPTETKPINIPLENVWAHRMPGASPVEKIDESLVLEIRRSLWSLPSKDEGLAKGFAVGGTGKEALSKAHSILAKKRPPRKSFSAKQEVSVVFFSYQGRPYVHVHRVEREGNILNIRFRFVPHETEETTEHFALIPVGKLPPGKYSVKIIQSPLEKKYIDQGFQPISREVAKRIVCNSFSFTVSEKGK